MKNKNEKFECAKLNKTTLVMIGFLVGVLIFLMTTGILLKNNAYGFASSIAETMATADLTATGVISSSKTGGTALSLTGVPAAVGTSSLWQMGSAIVGGESSGTYIGINSASGFGGNFIDLQAGGVSKVKVDSGGNLTVTGLLKDAFGYLRDYGYVERLKFAFNNGGFGGGATPGNTAMNANDVSVYNIETINSSARGFNGAVFDGRYIYFAPLRTSGAASGKIARYDTANTFTSDSSWSVYDTTAVNSNSKGFIGGVFDGRYVYFVPQNNGSVFGQVTRYDTTAGFTDAGSWSVFDTTTVNSNSKGFTGGVFDGRYVYFVPYYTASNVYSGQVTRYDTRGSFTDTGSWSVYDTTAIDSDSKGLTGGVFDGRYIYMVAYLSGKITRYDITGTFTSAGSWAVYDTTAVNSNSNGFSGCVFDGRYIYSVPFYNYSLLAYHGQVTRYDTTGTFTSVSSWSVYNTTAVNANSTNFIGGAFDGRYLYLVPYGAGGTTTFGGQITRYDTTGTFTSASSWSVYDMTAVNSNAMGFRGAVFDGHYIYLVPGNRSLTGSPVQHGNVARLKAWPGGVDSVVSLNKVARSSDFYIDSAGNVGIGTSTPLSLVEVASTGYLQISKTVAGTSTVATDCDADSERGRFVIDTTNNAFAICNGATRGWDTVTLTD